MITVFDDLYSLDTPRYVDIDYVLNSIYQEKIKELVDSVRAEKDKSKRNLIKKKLPCILFSGEFTKRSDSAMVKHSGYICIDFDNFEDVASIAIYRNFLIKDKYTYSVFVSPSGDGLKVIVKIPKDIKGHRSYFNGLKEYYNVKHFDVSCINESRICYMSSDKIIYINKESVRFSKKNKECENKSAESNDIKIPVTDSKEIIDRLYSWWNRKYGMVDGERNRNVYILSMAFNCFGISKSEAESFMTQFSHTGFEETEILQTVRNAYKRNELFNTRKLKAYGNNR